MGPDDGVIPAMVQVHTCNTISLPLLISPVLEESVQVDEAALGSLQSEVWMTFDLWRPCYLLHSLYLRKRREERGERGREEGGKGGRKRE